MQASGYRKYDPGTLGTGTGICQLEYERIFQDGNTPGRLNTN